MRRPCDAPRRFPLEPRIGLVPLGELVEEFEYGLEDRGVVLGGVRAGRPGRSARILARRSERSVLIRAVRSAKWAALVPSADGGRIGPEAIEDEIELAAIGELVEEVAEVPE